jgi:hypothetical protein
MCGKLRKTDLFRRVTNPLEPQTQSSEIPMQSSSMKLRVKSAPEDGSAIIHPFIEAWRICMAKCKSALDAPPESTVRQTILANQETIKLRSQFEHKCTSLDEIIATVDSIGRKKLRLGLQRDLNHSIARYRKLSKKVRSGKVRLARRSKGQTRDYVRNMCRKVRNHKSKS